MQNFLKSLNKPENMEKMWHFDGICIKFGQVQQIIQTFEFFFLKYPSLNSHFKEIFEKIRSLNFSLLLCGVQGCYIVITIIFG